MLIGLAGVTFGLARFLAVAHDLAFLLSLAAGVILSIAAVWIGMKFESKRGFLIYLTSIWLVSRVAVVLLFPHYVLPGDEAYFHNFVGKLIMVWPHGNISSLSDIYDFPVWLSRAFPFYIWFSPNQLMAARYMNVLLGAAQLLCVFFIVQMLAGSRAARLTCLLFLVFPYHCVNVLSYDPQIAGTFFLLLGVYLILCLLRREYSVWQLVTVALGLGLSLLFAGIQRGGIDLLLVFVMSLTVLCLVALPGQRLTSRGLVTLFAAVVLIWLPCRTAFGIWIASNDAHNLRTHALGFMTRGWNLVTSGEYLPLYEQLDVVSPKPEKNRVLASVLITEFARQPLRALALLPVIKIAKLFAIGYASTAEVGLELGGYGTAAKVCQGLRSVYAPVMLALCAYGLLRCISRRRLVIRLMLPVMFITFSCAGIVLLWETSPRYSHPFHFAVLILAAFGILGLSKKGLSRSRTAIVPVASYACLMLSCWAILSVAVFAACRLCKPYLFVDPRSLAVSVDDKPVEVSPIHPHTEAWEGAVEIQPGTALPATIRIRIPSGAVVYLWLPDSEVALLPPIASGRIERAVIPRNDKSGLVVAIQSKDGSPVARGTLRLGVGYIQWKN